MTPSKSMRRAGNIKTPYAICRFIDEVIRQPLSSDVFGHSNAYDCIVKLAAAPGNFAIIAQFDLRLVCQSSLCNPGARPFRLRRAQSDSLGVHAKIFRSVNDERAPATTDIEETLACSET